MVDVGDYKVGLFGLTTAGTAVKSSPGPITFADPVATAEAMAAQLREAGADLVIAVAHTDRREDDELIRAAPVDLVLSGDDHDLASPTTADGAGRERQPGRVRLGDHADDGHGRGQRRPELRLGAGLRADQHRVGRARCRGSPRRSRAMPTSSRPSSTSRSARPRSRSTAGAPPCGRRNRRSRNLMADAIREAVGADVALTNGGGIRADRTYEPGTVLTRRDIQSELPFGNKTILIEVTRRRPARRARERRQRGRGRRRPLPAGLGADVQLRCLEACRRARDGGPGRRRAARRWRAPSSSRPTTSSARAATAMPCSSTSRGSSTPMPPR